MWPAQKKIVSLDKLHYHHDPFYNECRAYGRLKETQLDGIVAVRCHGYTTLPPTLEAELYQRFHISTWDRDDDDKPVEERAMFRAILKDLIQDDTPLTLRAARKMKQHLLQIREKGIYPYDIKATNCKGGLLVDFSNAMTEPHYLLETKPDKYVEMLKKEDLFQFDDMFKDTQIGTRVRALPNQDTIGKLRRRDYFGEQYGVETPSIAD